MAIVTTDDRHYRDIAEAIRTKFGTTDQYKPEEMAPAVMNLDSYEEYLGEITGFGTLENTSWEYIKAAASVGEGANYWAVGDTKSVLISGTVGVLPINSTYYVYILGFNHNENYEGKGIHFGFGKFADGRDILLADSRYDSHDSDPAFRMNLSRTNSGGWEACYMRTTICPAFLAALPAELQEAIAETPKYTLNGSAVSATNDKIFFEAEYEVFGVIKNANSSEETYQKQYAYYAAGNSKIKYRQDTLGTAPWWLRSPYSDYGFCVCSSSGAISALPANASFGFAPAFKVG